MKRIQQISICLLLNIILAHFSYAQKADTLAKATAPHVYFIITAGTDINAFFNDKPVQASTIDEFSYYVQANIKSMKDSWVIITGTPKTGTFDEVMRILKRNRFKHISINNGGQLH